MGSDARHSGALPLNRGGLGGSSTFMHRFKDQGAVLIVSFLVPNLRLQTKRGFSRFVGE
jgi:hypothetical protein